jgi:type I restriction enzyme S subunit
MKAGYKQTEVGVIPEDWEVKSLSQLASLYQPHTISAKQFTESGFPVYGANGVVGYYHSANHETWQVTVTCRGSTCGTVNRTLDRCWITGNAMVLNCDQNKRLNKEFFYHLMLGQDMSECITGTGQPQIVRSPLAAFRVALPNDPPEQRAIAEALSDVDGLLGGLDRLIAKKRDLKQAAMQQLLTGQTRLPGFHGEWEVKRLGDFGKCLRGVSYKGDSDLSTHDTTQTKRLLRSNNVQNAVVVTDEVQFVNAVRVSSHQILKRGDILICMANGSKSLVGKAGIFMLCDGHEYTFGAFMGCFRTDSANAIPAFIFYLFLTNRYRDYINNLLAGSSINNLRPSSIESLEFCIPPLPEQTAIAEILIDMDAELTALEQRREKTRALKQAMMQELLTGKTRLL